MHQRSPRPLIAAVISTLNRAPLLQGMLESLTQQTLPPQEYEVVVVDDGSTDETRGIAQAFAARLPIKYVYQRNAGLASARNHGLYLSTAPLLLFLDDDDVAEPDLLEQHVATHRRYDGDHYAVLGYTRLDPAIADDPLMHFVTEVGCFLFSYPNFKDGDVLDWEHFWGGRSSCKRAFLLEHGVFNPVFRFGCEDVELAYRLSRHRFRVVYNAKAVTTMVRGSDFEAFCGRLVRQGRSNFVFSRLHPDKEIQRWTEVLGFDETWRAIEPTYEVTLAIARHLDRTTRLKQAAEFSLEDGETTLLHDAYWAAFRAARLKGVKDAKLEAAGTTPCQHPGGQEPRSGGGDRVVAAAGVSAEPRFHAKEDAAVSARSPEEPDAAQLEIQIRDETIRLLRAQCERQQQVIKELNWAVQDMRHSLGWRIVSSFRAVYRRLRSPARRGA